MELKLGAYISELLYRNDCVVIPGLGGFVASYEPAKIHPVQHEMTPPAKKVVFNRQLKDNDGLLANHIAQEENLQFSQAERLLEQKVKAIQQKLDDGKKVELEKIGTLSQDKEGNINFEPETGSNFLVQSFGLENIQSSPVKRQGQRGKIKTFGDRKLAATDRTATIRKIAPYAAAAAIIGLLIYIPLGTDLFKNKKVDFARLNPFTSHAESVYVPRELKLPETSAAPKTLVLEEAAKGEKAVVKFSFTDSKATTENGKGVYVRLKKEKPKEKEKTPVKSESAVENRQYFIIGGAFRNYTGAKRFTARLRNDGYDAFILEEPNQPLHKVSYAGYPTKPEAIAELRKIQLSYDRSAWVYRMRE